MHGARTSVSQLFDATFVRRVAKHKVAQLKIVYGLDVAKGAKHRDFVTVVF